MLCFSRYHHQLLISETMSRNAYPVIRVLLHVYTHKSPLRKSSSISLIVTTFSLSIYIQQHMQVCTFHLFFFFRIISPAGVTAVSERDTGTALLKSVNKCENSYIKHTNQFKGIILSLREQYSKNLCMIKRGTRETETEKKEKWGV